MTQTPPRLGYLPALDGLRALAIVLVVASHAHPSFLKGGELGVDVFFALSGFLITTLIMQELDRGTGPYAFGKFYARRSLRLFPALYATVAVVAVYLVLRRDHLGEFLLAAGVETPYPWTTWAKFVAGAATYTTNLIGVIRTPGNLLGHTWSLAVEEQFYLVWPVVLVAVWRRRAAAALAGVLVAFILGLLVVRQFASSEAGILWQRPEAIAAGSLAALLRYHVVGVRSFVERHATVILWVGMLVVGLPPLSRPFEEKLFEWGVIGIYGTFAALTVWALAEAPDRHPIRRVFELGPVVYLGTISYSLYIWHVPAFRIVTWEFPSLSGPVNVALKLAVACVAAVLSAKIIEQPFRRAQARFRSPASADAAPTA